MNKVLSAAQWQAADSRIMQAEGISSLELMERAAQACVEWLLVHWQQPKKILVVAGHGNNGGDGLAIARLLSQKGYDIKVYRINDGQYTADNQANAEALSPNLFINHEWLPNTLSGCDVVIDALLGFGTSRKADGAYASIIQLLNERANKPIYSIDLPSGMPAEKPFNHDWPVVKASHTLCIEGWKLNLLLPHGGKLAGEVHFIPIGLSKVLTDSEGIARIFDPATVSFPTRQRFAHKGHFGHALLVAGSAGLWGAAILATEACLRIGAGKTTLAAPQEVKAVLACRLPEAMFVTTGDAAWELPIDTKPFTALGIGPGLGKSPTTKHALHSLLREYKGPLVLDADALNILAEQADVLDELPENTILTPHMGEFDRLFGLHDNWWARLETARNIANSKGWVIVLKNAYTFTFSKGQLLPVVNTSGNPGLAKAGSGDVLIGIIAGLLAQGMTATDAATLGVYLHGLAADFAKELLPEPSILGSDVVLNIGKAISSLATTKSLE